MQLRGYVKLLGSTDGKAGARMRSDRRLRHSLGGQVCLRTVSHYVRASHATRDWQSLGHLFRSDSDFGRARHRLARALRFTASGCRGSLSPALEFRGKQGQDLFRGHGVQIVGQIELLDHGHQTPHISRTRPCRRAAFGSPSTRVWREMEAIHRFDESAIGDQLHP